MLFVAIFAGLNLSAGNKENGKNILKANIDKHVYTCLLWLTKYTETEIWVYKPFRGERVWHIKYTEFSNFIYLEQLLSTMCTCSQLLWIIFKKLYVSFNPTKVFQTGLTRKKWFLNGLEM